MSTMTIERDRPTIRIPGNGLQFQLFDATVTCTVVGDDTGGAYSVFEQRLPVGGIVPPCRAQAYEMACYVLEGAVSIRIGEQTVLAQAGTIVRVPRGTAFAFKTVGCEAAKFLSVVTPGGMERLLEALGELTPDERRDRGRVAALLSSHGVEIVEEGPLSTAIVRDRRPMVGSRLCAAFGG